jgi:hypothetical protein
LSLFLLPSLSLISEIAVVFALLLARKKLKPELKILGAYFVVCLIAGLFEILLASKGINNLWIFHYFTPIEYALLMFMFYSWNQRSPVGKLILYSIPIFIGLWLMGSFWLANPADTFSYAYPVSEVLLVLVSSYTLIRIERLEKSSLLDMPEFWASSGTLIYFGGTIVWSSLNSPLLHTSLEIMRLAWSTQSVANILANLLYAGAFLCLLRKT